MSRKAYTELLLEHSHPISYSVLLSSIEWGSFRAGVIQRESNTCQRCNKACNDGYMPKRIGGPNGFLAEVPYVEVWGTKPTDIIWHGEIMGQYDRETLKMVPMKVPLIGHVHHTYYIQGKLPWEYPLQDLQLLCHICHAYIHDHTRILVYESEERKQATYLTPCSRCHGTGYLVKYDHVQDGICFQCNGSCFDEWK